MYPYGYDLGVHVPLNHQLQQGLPTWGTCTPMGTFAYLKGCIFVQPQQIDLVTYFIEHLKI